MTRFSNGHEKENLLDLRRAMPDRKFGDGILQYLALRCIQKLHRLPIMVRCRAVLGAAMWRYSNTATRFPVVVSGKYSVYGAFSRISLADTRTGAYTRT